MKPSFLFFLEAVGHLWYLLMCLNHLRMWHVRLFAYGAHRHRCVCICTPFFQTPLFSKQALTHPLSHTYMCRPRPTKGPKEQHASAWMEGQCSTGLPGSRLSIASLLAPDQWYQCIHTRRNQEAHDMNAKAHQGARLDLALASLSHCRFEYV